MSKELLSKMTLEEKIGQMLCFAFHGTEYNEQLKILIEDHHVGTIIHFARNIENLDQIYKLNKAIHEKSKYPMFIGLDHEGGMVRRVMEDITYLPGAMALSNATDEELYKIYNQTGKELKILGFNMNYMPSVDVNNNPYNPVINSRSYSDEPNMVSKRGGIAAVAMQDALVLPTLKHFPGHGNTSVDSHVGLPIVEDTLEQLFETELVPFKEIIKKGIDGVMVAHILYKKIDDELPSSLSYKVITNLLKEKLGYKKLVITDSLTMSAIYNRYSLKEIVEKGINAGNDIIMFCGKATLDEQETIINDFINLVKEGKIKEERINESVLKILKLKEKYKTKLGKNYLDKEFIKNNFNQEKELSKLLTKKSITAFVRNELLPINENDKVLSVFPKINLATLVDNATNDCTTIGSILKCDEIIYDEKENNLENIVQNASKYDKIILATYNTNKDGYGCKIYNSLDKSKVICVALRSPYDIIHLGECDNYICSFDCTKESIKAISNALLTNEFSVKLPINLNIKK